MFLPVTAQVCSSVRIMARTVAESSRRSPSPEAITFMDRSSSYIAMQPSMPKTTSIWQIFRSHHSCGTCAEPIRRQHRLGKASIDLREGDDYTASCADLLCTLHGQHLPEPPLGARPNFLMSSIAARPEQQPGQSQRQRKQPHVPARPQPRAGRPHE